LPETGKPPPHTRCGGWGWRLNYYNEWDKYAAQWLRNLIAAGHLPKGEVDERSIADVSPDDLAGFTQCHFFAGIGGWSLAARLAGWPEDRELWTGSPPCQPFSVAGKQLGQDDSRHLWPHYFRLIAARRPAVLMGEQVAAAVGKNWLDGVHADLEGIGYSCGAAVVPACAVNAPHRRDRLWFVANPASEGGCGRESMENRGGSEFGGPSAASSNCATAGSGGSFMADACSGRRAGSLDRQGEQSRGAEAVGTGEGDVADAESLRWEGRDLRGETGLQAHGTSEGGAWDSVLADPTIRANERGQPQPSFWTVPTLDGSGNAWIIGHDGKARRVEPSICLLAHGVPARVGKLRAYGNAIVPQVAAEVIGAYLECRP